MNDTIHTDNRLEDLISTLKHWLWETDRDGRYTYSSPQAKALLGYSTKDILKLTPIDLLHSPETDDGGQKLSKILASQESFENVRKYNLHSNGKSVLLEMSGRPYYDTAGNFAGYRGSSQSVTEPYEVSENDTFRVSLLESIEQPIMISNAEGEIRYINHAFTELFGYAFDEIVGSNENVLYPNQVAGDTEQQHLPPELNAEQHAHGVRRRLKKDGDAVTVLINSRSLTDPQDNVSQFVSAYRDLSEIEEYQSQLQDLNRKGQLLEQSQAMAQVGGWELDIPTNSLYWTNETYRIHDTTPEEFNPTVDAGTGCYLPKSRKIIKAALEAAITEGKGYDLVLEAYTTKGRKIDVRTTCEVTLKDGRPSKLTGLFQDISSFVSKEKSLLFSLKENELALAAANLGFWVLDRTKRTLEWNDRQLEFYGVSREEFNKDPSPEKYQNMTHKDDREALDESLVAIREGKTIQNRIFRIVRKSGEVRTLQGSAAPITDNRGMVTKLIGINRDITEINRDKDKIENLLGELSNSLHGTINLAVNIAGMRDPYTAGHEHRVGIISSEIGKILGLSTFAIEGLIECGNLHDIGKSGVPLDILNKPGRLSSAEFEIVKQHAQEGYEVLKGIQFPWPIAKVALQHHERMDGSGYPQGLKGDEIILEARILAVADVVEAMAAHRPYRERLGIDKALEEIESGRGIKYDAQVVDACLTLFRELGFELPSTSF